MGGGYGGGEPYFVSLVCRNSLWISIIFTLQDKIFPKAPNVSQRALLSMLLSKFLMKMFPTPDFLRLGSLCVHIIRMGLSPLIGSKFN